MIFFDIALMNRIREAQSITKDELEEVCSPRWKLNLELDRLVRLDAVGIQDDVVRYIGEPSRYRAR